MDRITRDKVVYAMDRAAAPRMRIRAGQRLAVETEDCFSHQVVGAADLLGPDFDYSRVNPATGPIHVDGCSAGDTLRVDILRIDLDSRGVVVAYPGWGPLGKEVRQSVTKVVEITGGKADFDGVLLPVRPMIGVIGVAPSEGSVACGVPGAHGGNLDTVFITEGASVFLPVYSDGALLSLGDVHAVMGDGEACGTGVETRAEVEIRVEVHRGLDLPGPVVRDERCYYFLSSDKSLDEAAAAAVRNVVGLMSARRGIPWIDAYMLASIAVDLQISQIVNPLKTARVRVPRELIGEL